MEKIIIEFLKEDKEFENLLVELYGSNIKNNFIETNNFNGDIVDVFISIIIPVAIPFLQVLYQKRLEKNKKVEDGRKTIRFIKDGQEISFENYDINEIREILRNNIGEGSESQKAK